MLSVHEVTTAYQGLVAISAISIEVARGEIVCVAGANGAGKSTLLKSIAGAERPRSGTVSFDGNRIDGLAQHVITSRGIAYVPENRRLFPRLSVRDNLRLGSYRFRGQANREEPLHLVFQLFPRLQERLEQRAETLSGGEQQMLAISRALMTRPRLLMLDEPSQGIMVANQMITETRIEQASDRASRSQRVAENSLSAHIDLRKIQLAARDVRLARTSAEVDKTIADLQRFKASKAKELEAALSAAHDFPSFWPAYFFRCHDDRCPRWIAVACRCLIKSWNRVL